MARANDRGLSSTNFVFAALGRVPYDRQDAALIYRQRQDSYRILFKRSFEQRVDVPEP